ncbi:3-deoxy-7-phosphoheptulonate synthase, partial [Planococcus sp. SIMBA_143]
MIIHVAHGSKEKEIQELVKNIEAAGFGVNRSDGKNRTVIGLIGDTSRVTENDFAKYKIVDGVHRIQA